MGTITKQENSSFNEADNEAIKLFRNRESLASKSRLLWDLFSKRSSMYGAEQILFNLISFLSSYSDEKQRDIISALEHKYFQSNILYDALIKPTLQRGQNRLRSIRDKIAECIDERNKISKLESTSSPRYINKMNADILEKYGKKILLISDIFQEKKPSIFEDVTIPLGVAIQSTTVDIKGRAIQNPRILLNPIGLGSMRYDEDVLDIVLHEHCHLVKNVQGLEDAVFNEPELASYLTHQLKTFKVMYPIIKNIINDLKINEFNGLTKADFSECPTMSGEFRSENYANAFNIEDIIYTGLTIGNGIVSAQNYSNRLCILYVTLDAFLKAFPESEPILSPAISTYKGELFKRAETLVIDRLLGTVAVEIFKSHFKSKREIKNCNLFYI